MIELKCVKFDPVNLLVGYNYKVHPASYPEGQWTALYLHEGKLYLLPVRAFKFNACRDEARKHYNENKSIITLSHDMPSHVVKDWEIFSAATGWRWDFTYDALAGQLTYVKGDSAMLSADPEPEPEDFPLTMGADHHMSAEQLVETTEKLIAMGSIKDLIVGDPLAEEAEKFPAYWKPLPSNWRAIDTYRVDVLFPLGDSRLTHARKKLLVCGTRTGGKSIYKDIAEAHATLGQWLKENPEG